MKNGLKKVLYGLGYLIVAVALIGLVLAYLPAKPKMSHNSIAEETATTLRQNFKGTHHLITTTDNQTLFLHRWNPDSAGSARKDVAVLLFHGITAHSGAGAYNRACETIAEGGFTTFGMDYRGHGLSSGNRGDCPNKERWQADMKETVRYIKGLGYSKVVILGHSLGVAAAMFATMGIPDEISASQLPHLPDTTGSRGRVPTRHRLPPRGSHTPR